MIYHGIMQDGQVKVAGGIPLPDGVEVDFHINVRATDAEESTGNGSAAAPTSGAFPESLIGCIKDWPEDMAERHDHYLHGRNSE